MYITRMWFSENERKAFIACTSTGYKLVGVAGWVGLLGWIVLLLLLGIFAFAWIGQRFEAPTLWLVALPLVFRLVAGRLDGFGRSLAHRKRFQYYYKPDFASWVENGVLVTYPPGRQVEVSPVGAANES